MTKRSGWRFESPILTIRLSMREAGTPVRTQAAMTRRSPGGSPKTDMGLRAG
jgi:hypothetical protein